MFPDTYWWNLFMAYEELYWPVRTFDELLYDDDLNEMAKRKLCATWLVIQITGSY